MLLARESAANGISLSRCRRHGTGRSRGESHGHRAAGRDRAGAGAHRRAGPDAHARARLRALAGEPGQLVRRVGRGVPGGRGHRPSWASSRGPGSAPSSTPPSTASGGTCAGWPASTRRCRTCTSSPPRASTRTPTCRPSSPSGAWCAARPPRAHGRPVRAGRPGGHPGHRHQGGVLQVRHRPPRPDARGRADHAGGGPGARRDGAPIMVHNDPGRNTMADVRRVLGEEGVEPRHVLLAHVGDSTDVDLLTELAEAGFLLGMDRFGIDAILDLGGRAGTVASCAAGAWPRMVLSHDASCYIDWIDPDLLVAATNWHYLHITNDVLPALAERGSPTTRSTRCWSATPAPGSSADCDPGPRPADATVTPLSVGIRGGARRWRTARSPARSGSGSSWLRSTPAGRTPRSRSSATSTSSSTSTGSGSTRRGSASTTRPATRSSPRPRCSSAWPPSAPGTSASAPACRRCPTTTR